MYPTVLDAEPTQGCFNAIDRYDTNTFSHFGRATDTMGTVLYLILRSFIDSLLRTLSLSRGFSR
jgi:hypothetical protein